VVATRAEQTYNAVMCSTGVVTMSTIDVSTTYCYHASGEKFIASKLCAVTEIACISMYCNDIKKIVVGKIL